MSLFVAISILLVGSLAAAPPVLINPLKEPLAKLSSETKMLMSEVGQKLGLSYSDGDDPIFSQGMFQLDQLSKHANYSSMSKRQFGQLLKRSCKELTDELGAAVQKIRSRQNNRRTQYQNRWLIAFDSCQELDELQFNDMLHSGFKFDKTKKELKALAAFRSQLGLSRAQEESNDLREVVDGGAVDEALLRLFKDREFMKPIKALRKPVIRDVYVRLRDICDRFDSQLRTCLTAVEFGLAPESADQKLVDQLRSLKVCDLFPIDEGRLKDLPHRETKKTTSSKTSWKDKIFGNR